MAVVPLELNSVFADGFGGNWFWRGLKHRQFAGFGLDRLSGAATGFRALFVAESAGAGVAQEGESVVREMSVFPFDFESGARGQVDFDGFGVGREH